MNSPKTLTAGGGKRRRRRRNWGGSISRTYYLLEFFDYNIDEDRIFGQKSHSWPLKESAKKRTKKMIGALLTALGFAKGDFDLKSVMDDFRLTEETFDEEKIEKIEENKDKPKPTKYGEDLPYTYANLIKNISLIFTFGLASTSTAGIGCLGIFCRWLALSFLAKRYDNKKQGQRKNRRTRYTF